jgi:hypothetical protein
MGEKRVIMRPREARPLVSAAIARELKALPDPLVSTGFAFKNDIRYPHRLETRGIAAWKGMEQKK